MYDVEIDKVIDKIKEQKAKSVLIQLPEGLKSKVQIIADSIEGQTNAKTFIWLGNCYGACDLPMGIDALNIDLIIQWGHNKFNKEMW